MRIYCCGCTRYVDARLTNGIEVYPHRGDLSRIPFWKCDGCGNHVGCHHRSNDKTKPLGSIPTGDIRRVRMIVHHTLDPLWKSGRYKREHLYSILSREFPMGRGRYHTGNIRSVDEGMKIIDFIKGL